MISKIILIVIIIIMIYLLVNNYNKEAKLSNSEVVDTSSKFESQLSALPSDVDTKKIDDITSDYSSSWDTRSSMNNTNDPIENFRANGFDNPVIDQGTMDNAYAMLSLSLTSGGDDSLSHRSIIHQVPNTEYIALITEIKDAIASKVINRAKTCQNMHGSEVKLGDGNQTLTLACETDPYSLQDEIIEDIYNIIYPYIKNKFGINLNPYLVHHDLHRHLNLMEGIIYPLQYSGLYTVHGVQYTTERWIRNKVQNDIDVRHILFTVFSRRNIEIEVNTNQHIH